MRTVSKISIAPVKSLALEHPESITLETWGAVGNRSFFLVGDDGRLVNGAKIGQLVQVRAHHDAASDTLTLTFPDGGVVEGLSSATGPQVKTDFYGDHIVASHVVEGPFSAALSAFAGRALRLVRSDEPGAANDIWPASMLSRASVGELAERVRTAAAPLGLSASVQHLRNPRVEREQHYYRAVHTGLHDLGLEPHRLSDALLHSLLEIALRYRDRARPEVILPGVDWRLPAGVSGAGRRSQTRS